MDAQSVIAVDTAVLPWEERFNEKLGMPCTGRT